VTDRIDRAGLIVSVALLLLVLELVRRKRLNEEFSILWIAGALAVLALSLRRDLLDRTAQWLGVYYPPSLLLLILLVVVFIGSLTISVVLSRHRRQIERLMEDSAIHAAELRELREKTVDRETVHSGRRSAGREGGQASRS
jgi:hypothetical protein